MTAKKWPDLVGQEVGELKVLGLADRSHVSRRTYLSVVCKKCGNKKDIALDSVQKIRKSGTAGCQCISPSYKHGHSSHPAYGTWEGMICRCYHESHQAYSNYGGRGIFVCPEWRSSPNRFIEWLMRNGWRKGKQIDRIDNDGCYEPSNCRVVSCSENLSNTRRNRYLVVDGEKMTIARASKVFGINPTTIKYRLDAGWPDEKAVSQKSFLGNNQWMKSKN